ncbi:MAG: hypothetical protein IPK46_12660 [Saprospiraceae bacterium]|nr:hypothetical protein [Saprospiraceae bacterium]
MIGLGPPVWSFAIVNEGLCVTGVVAVSVVGPGTWVVVTLAVFTKLAPASMSACVAV